MATMITMQKAMNMIDDGGGDDDDDDDDDDDGDDDDGDGADGSGFLAIYITPKTRSFSHESHGLSRQPDTSPRPLG